jgi:hypothetical protein
MHPKSLLVLYTDISTVITNKARYYLLYMRTLRKKLID